MTAATEQFNRRMHTALDRLAWGFGDCRRLLAQRGLWPAAAQALASPDGTRWLLAQERLRERNDSRKPQGLLVPEAECLWGHLQLPDMPRKALGNAVDEAMWRVSPLPPDQIAAAWTAEPHGDSWAVEWGMCRRTLLSEAQSQWGLDAAAPVYLARAGRALPVRTVAWQAQAKRQRWMDGLIAAALALVLAALAAPALMPLVLKREGVVRAMLHISELEPQAAPLRPQLEELRQQATMAADLRKSMADAVPLARVIDELSAALPDDTWLDRIEVNGGDIRITGLTGNAADLIASLGRQPAFADVHSTGASVRDGGLNKERFIFEMRWRGEEKKP
ncbi:MAG: PilN domain-containing protein [Acidovorax sp.]